MNIEGWQAGLLAGAAFSLVLDRAWLRFLLWRQRRRHRCDKSAHCSRCGGCLEPDDTMPDTHPKVAVDPEAFGRLVAVYPGDGIERLEEAIRELTENVPQGPDVRLVSESDPASVAIPPRPQ